MTFAEWIEENRKELERHIKQACPNCGELDEDEIETWVLNDEFLYNWAYMDNVEGV